MGALSPPSGLSRAAFLLPLLVLACAATTLPVRPDDAARAVAVSEPPEGTEQERNVGEVLVARGRQFIAPAIRVLALTQFNKAEGERSWRTCAWSVLPGEYPRIGYYVHEPHGADCFGPVPTRITNSRGDTGGCSSTIFQTDVCRAPDGSWFMATISKALPLKQDFDQLELVERTVARPGSRLAELLYAGRSDTSLRVVYREQVGEQAATTQPLELELGLGASREIDVHGMRIEVLDATNTTIRYRVMPSL